MGVLPPAVDPRPLVREVVPEVAPPHRALDPEGGPAERPRREQVLGQGAQLPSRLQLGLLAARLSTWRETWKAQRPPRRRRLAARRRHLRAPAAVRPLLFIAPPQDGRISSFAANPRLRRRFSLIQGRRAGEAPDPGRAFRPSGEVDSFDFFHKEGRRPASTPEFGHTFVL